MVGLLDDSPGAWPSLAAAMVVYGSLEHSPQDELLMDVDDDVRSFVSDDTPDVAAPLSPPTGPRAPVTPPVRAPESPQAPRQVAAPAGLPLPPPLSPPPAEADNPRD